MNDTRLLKKINYLAMTVLLILAVIGCSGSESDVSQQSPREEAAQAADQPLAACSLLTEEEWETLVGPSSVAPSQTDSEATYVTPPEHTSLCSYASNQGSIVLFIRRPFGIKAADSEALAAELISDQADVEGGLGDIEIQPLDGLGVPAVWYDIPEGFQVWVVAISPAGGGTYLRVQSLGFPLEHAQTIAEMVLTRLS